MMTDIESRNRRFLMRLSFAAVLALVAGDELHAELKIAPQKYPAGQRDWNAWLPYVASHKPSRRANPAIKRVLISIHSSGYDALQYYENARAAASKVRGATDETLIIAPQFLLKRVIPGPVPAGMLYWRTAPYRGSSRAAIGREARPVSLSAFQVLDDMLKQLCNRKTFPNLRDVVLVGHSAGGQMVQRYALAGRFEPPAGIRCRFVVCAPSSFAYPTDERKVPGPGMKFAKPTGATLEAAPTYNNWGYGLNKMYAYMQKLKADALKRRYAKRNVYYICGERDTNADDGSTSQTPGAMLQGKHRRERTEVFYAYLIHTYGPAITQRHKMAIAPRVRHYGRGNMTSTAGLRFLFADSA